MENNIFNNFNKEIIVRKNYGEIGNFFEGYTGEALKERQWVMSILLNEIPKRVEENLGTYEQNYTFAHYKGVDILIKNATGPVKANWYINTPKGVINISDKDRFILINI
jgi:hypothetical protein